MVFMGGKRALGDLRPARDALQRYNVLERTAENRDKSFCPFRVNHFRHLPNVVVLVWFIRILTRFHFSLSALPRQPEEPEHGHRHPPELRQAGPARGLARDHGARDGPQLRVTGEYGDWRQ